MNLILIYSTIVGLVNSYLIRGIFISVLVILINSKFLKNKLDTHHPLIIIKWILIGYAVLILFDYLLIIVFTADSAAFISRATGPYWWAFLPVVLSNALLPFLLFFKKLQYNIYFIFILTILMNTGWLMESLVIHTTIIHRDYSTGINSYFPSDYELFIMIKGFLVGLIVMVIGNLVPNKTEQPVQ